MIAKQCGENGSLLDGPSWKDCLVWLGCGLGAASFLTAGIAASQAYLAKFCHGVPLKRYQFILSQAFISVSLIDSLWTPVTNLGDYLRDLAHDISPVLGSIVAPMNYFLFYTTFMALPFQVIWNKSNHIFNPHAMYPACDRTDSQIIFRVDIEFVAVLTLAYLGFNYGPIFFDKATADKYACQDECGAGEASINVLAAGTSTALLPLIYLFILAKQASRDLQYWTSRIVKFRGDSEAQTVSSEGPHQLMLNQELLARYESDKPDEGSSMKKVGDSFFGCAAIVATGVTAAVRCVSSSLNPS